MASISVSLSEQQFQCSICLEIFTEPVSTPCGHNYCKHCIRDYWAHADCSQCPLCKKTFPRTPELQVNTEFRDMLELFKQTRATSDDSSSPLCPGEVPCDLCQGKKHKAVKSCLVCLASYCSTHLQPHHTVPAFQWHNLINPVATLADRMCKKHNKAMDIFCRNEQNCICFLCLRDDHVGHDTVALEEAFNEKKNEFKCLKREVDHRVHDECVMLQRIQNSAKQSRQEVEKTKAETVRAFTALVAKIETKKVKLIEQLEEKQKVAEQKAEALIRQLQLQIAENHQMSTKLEQLSTTEDSFTLFQSLASVSSPPYSTHSFTATSPRSFFEVETMRSAVAKIEEALDQQIEVIIRDNQVDEEGAAEGMMDMQTQNVFDDELGKIQEQCATQVTLDPNTAHPALIISEGRKQVRDGGTKRNVPDNPSRFDSLHFVLGNEGFSSGRFYYEVTVKGQTGWEVGVVRESISKKGTDLSLSPEYGCWTLGSHQGRCQANTNPPAILTLSKEPQKVGVLVDYDGGLVSFYDVDTRELMYSFTKCAFTANASRLSLWFYTGIKAKTMIYPIFRPSADGSGLLKITPVGRTEGI